MKPKNTKSKWWLVAISAPVLFLVFGLLRGLRAPSNENDWLGMRVIVPMFWASVFGCVVSCVAALISLLRRERLRVVALIAGIPSLCFLIHVYSLVEESKQLERRNRIASARQQKRDADLGAKITLCCNEIRANPQLLTSDEFWRGKGDSNGLAQVVLANVLQDKSFDVTPEIKSYVMTNFPMEALWVFAYGRSSHKELIDVAADKGFPYAVREAAIDQLLRDSSFDFTPELKQSVLTQFQTKMTLLFATRRLTKRELEELIADSKTPDWVKRDAAERLKSGFYKIESPQTP